MLAGTVAATRIILCMQAENGKLQSHLEWPKTGPDIIIMIIVIMCVL